MHRKQISEEEYRDAAKSSESIAEIARKLGLYPGGGNYTTISRKIKRYDIDTSHFKKTSWNKNNYSDQPNSKGAIKRKLIRDRGHQCQKCLNTHWMNELITLELEHIDGNNSNNSLENLLLLCPNCHSLTPTWRRKKNKDYSNSNRICPKCGGNKQARSKHCQSCSRQIPSNHARKAQSVPHKIVVRKNRPKDKICMCGEKIYATSVSCANCYHKISAKINWPTVSELIALINATSFVQVANDLGVSDNAIRKHLKSRGIDAKSLKAR